MRSMDVVRRLRLGCKKVARKQAVSLSICHADRLEAVIVVVRGDHNGR